MKKRLRKKLLKQGRAPRRRPQFRCRVPLHTAKDLLLTTPMDDGSGFLCPVCRKWVPSPRGEVRNVGGKITIAWSAFAHLCRAPLHNPGCPRSEPHDCGHWPKKHPYPPRTYANCPIVKYGQPPLLPAYFTKLLERDCIEIHAAALKHQHALGQTPRKE